MSKCLMILFIGVVSLIVISTYNFIKMNHCLKKHQDEWNELKKILIKTHPNWGQDELMQKYIEYCRKINYSYIPRF